MTITNGYTTLDEFKARHAITGTASDNTLMGMIEAASRWIDVHCWRKFTTSIETRYFTPAPGDGLRLEVDDLLSVATLKTDPSGARVYDITWAASDYDLEPYNAAQLTPRRPYTRLRVVPYGTQYFPYGVNKSVQVAGSWGFSDQTAQASTLSAGVDGVTATWPVANGAAFGVGSIALCGSEQAFVDAIAGNSLTVRRGVNGTAAASHSSGAAVSVYQFGAINEACLLLAARLWKRKDAILGVSANTQLGQLTLKVPEDRDMLALLEPYRKLV